MTEEIFTLKEAAKARGKSRQWLEKMVKQKRVKVDIKDQSGKPYWKSPPQKIKPVKKGRPLDARKKK